MKLIIKKTNLALTQEVENYIEEKIGSLEKFSKIFESKIYFNHFLGKGKPRVEAWVEVEKTTRHHQKGPFFRTECQMRFPGKSLRAEAISEDLKTAITEVKDELQQEMKKYKLRKIDLERRGARSIKKKFHIISDARFRRK